MKITDEITKPKSLPISPTFILEREINCSPKDIKFINSLLNDARIIQNTVLAMAKKRYNQMVQSKSHRDLYKELKSINEQIESSPKEKNLKEERKMIISELKELGNKYRLNKTEFEKDAKIVRAYFHDRLDSVATQKAADRAWISFDKYLNKKSKRIHFLRFGENMSIEGKSNAASIVVECVEKNLTVRYGSYYFNLKPIKKNDLYMKETISHIQYFLETSPEKNNAVQENSKLAVSFLNGEITKEYYLKNFQSTYRVKYNRIVKKIIRGRDRFFLQMVLEGRPVPKRKKDGSFRHQLGKGKVGNDFGTQTVGVASDKKVALINLADEVDPIDHKIKLTQRKMERSRRNSNPAYFREDGTIKKGKKNWVYSKRYKKLKRKLKELHRKTATKRKLAHQTLANQLVRLGDTFIGEKMNFKALQKRKKETEKNEKGKFIRKKRFGKTLANKAPASFVSIYKTSVENLGGTFLLVNTIKFKASQYDHTTQRPVKKRLSQRCHTFSDGTKIQRDLYSSFLLKCSNQTLDKPDFKQCEIEFASFKEKHDSFIRQVIEENIKIKNSGIKPNVFSI